MLVVWPGGVLPSETGREGHGNMPGDGGKNSIQVGMGRMLSFYLHKNNKSSQILRTRPLTRLTKHLHDRNGSLISDREKKLDELLE